VKPLAFLVLFILPPLAGAAEVSPPNWGGGYAPCNRHTDLLTREHVDLGVRLNTSNAVLALQFARAMDFWTGVLDLEWHEVNSEDCAIELVDGTPALFDFCLCLSAKSQFPDRQAFQGWVAFNPRMKLTRNQMFLDSVHEIGHLLGLTHNPSDSSVMFYFGLNKSTSLDAADLEALATRHRLRPRISPLQKSSVAHARVSVLRQTGGHGHGWLEALASRMRPSGLGQAPVRPAPALPFHSADSR
jgi:hypothetical protein